MTERTHMSAADIARLAGVGRAAVSNWRRRHADFPNAVAGTEASPRFDATEVRDWLRNQGKLDQIDPLEELWSVLDSAGADADVLARWVRYLDGGDAQGVSPEHRRRLDELADPAPAELAERLCERFLSSGNRASHYTPPELAKLMVQFAQPSGTVFDPACGSGALLLAAAERSTALVGQELEPSIAALARARLARLPAEVRIEVGDALRADAFPGLRAESVLCNPPFGYRDWGYEKLGMDARWEYGVPVKAEPELAWVQHCLAHTKTGGTVVALLPAGVASRKSGRAIRQALVRRSAVRAIVALPPGLLLSTGIPLQLWVLRNPAQAGADPILLVDGSSLRPERRGQVDWPAMTSAVLTPWRQFSEAGTVEEIEGRQRVIEPIELLDDEVDLSPGRYLPLSTPTVDVEALRNAGARLAEQLTTLARDIPRVAARPDRRSVAMTTVSELSRAGVLTIRQQHIGKMEITDDPKAEGPLVMTGRDVATGKGPSSRLVAEPMVAAPTLEPGDIIVPVVSLGGGRSAAVVVEQSGLVLGPGAQLVRVDPHRLDPHFLAGYLRAGRSARASTQTASGAHRFDVRRVEIPVLDLQEQRELGERFRRMLELDVSLRDVASAGGRLVQQITDGLAEGALHM
ncbi:N-6 DNA methylase [Prauserella sp. PE36]|uniref:N-6 DNA methylase n=1 Tax=Prauserella sp. PE36 TaxID=1504709 RepID=UPI000DE236BD|nr:N-6 DNA methylase [Prauserella sp. PE36]RBM18663.1 N-6 DNA methylase [Prauserella sp. PE36]